VRRDLQTIFLGNAGRMDPSLRGEDVCILPVPVARRSAVPPNNRARRMVVDVVPLGGRANSSAFRSSRGEEERAPGGAPPGEQRDEILAGLGYTTR